MFLRSVCSFTFFSFPFVFFISNLPGQVIQTWREQHALQKRVQDYDVVQIVKRDGSVRSVQSETLVPGDIVLIPQNGAKIVYDAVLLSGHCIINESSLNGEKILIYIYALCKLKFRSRTFSYIIYVVRIPVR